jgi:hypothetical protein
VVKVHISRELPSAAEEAAEKLGKSDETGGEHPAGAEAHVNSIAFAARLKSCPFEAMSFSAACEAHLYLETNGTTKVVPFQSNESFRSL